MRYPKSPVELVLLIVPLAACRQDMHNQPRYDPLVGSTFFADGRSARPAIEGTVARGRLRVDEARFTGKSGGREVDTFPFAMTRADLQRGRERFDINCSPCHSRIGDGQGMIVKRGFKAPPAYWEERVMKAPLGHYFDVITNGFGAMHSYASRVEVDDRWRIIAYIRALQLAHTATVNDVPVERRADLDRPAEQQVPQPGETPHVPGPPRRGLDTRPEERK